MTAAVFVFAISAQAAAPASDPAAVRPTVDAYVRLYTKETLPEWRRLFLPGFTSTHTRDDGTVVTRTLDELYGAQERYFATGKAIREDLENVRIERKGRLASAWADFVLTEDGTKSRGRLVLLLMEEKGAWKVGGLMFSYD